MSTYELLDELEAGELSVQFEGEEPQALLEWALEEFTPRIAISAAFQADDVALIDMAYKIDADVRVFTVDTGRLPEETHELIASLREKYPRLKAWADTLLKRPSTHSFPEAEFEALYRANVRRRKKWLSQFIAEQAVAAE